MISIHSLEHIPESFVYAVQEGGPLIATQCGKCSGIGGKNYGKTRKPCDVRYVYDCENCNGIGYLGIDPHLPTVAPQGSQERVAVLAARYREGLPLWNSADLTHESSREGLGEFHLMRSGRAEKESNKRSKYDIDFDDDY